MKQSTNAWTESRALVQNSKGEMLIARTPGDETPWEFPGGRIDEGESPEHGVRRLCTHLLAADVEVLQGYPPFVHNFGSHSVTYRYMLCATVRGTPKTGQYAELRWVQTQQLRDYVFDAPTQQVVDWLCDR